MSCVASAFDSFRCAYRGVNDSVNDVDVDPSGGCLYAACSSGDVCVWNIQTQKLRVRLRHPQWVNAVRCFPMCNSAASSATSLQPPPAANPAAAAAGRADCDALNADLVVSHDIRWVLTGTEDGVIAVWCPVTYRMQSICRPGRAAITALQLIPETSPCAAEKANASKMEHCTTGARFRRASTKVNDGPAICCAASLRDVYVLRVTTASSELALLYAFQHQGLITALTYVAPSMSLSTPLLVVGQEEGTLCVWNCATWAYHDTMPYPTGEADVTADARDDPTSVHEPVYRLGRVFKTFLYNRRRCNPLSDQAAVEEEAAAAAPVDSPDYIGVVPASVSAEAIDVLERKCGILPYSAKQAFVEQQQQQQEPDDTRFPAALRVWRYDKRRVTCLAASPNPTSSNPNSYLYSGHATGEVLLWGSVRQEMPLLLLLKKIILFKPGVWVWNLCAVATLHTSASQPFEQRRGAKAAAKLLSRLEKNKANEGARRKAATPTPTRHARAGAPSPLETTHVSPLELIVWSDGGAVEYVSTRKRHVLHRQGPGFVCAAACAWSGPTITPLPAAEPVNTFDNGRAGAATSSTEAASKRSGGAARGSRSASAFSARQYLVMAGFDGRLERYDVTEVLELVKSSGKLV
ncbi:WD domain G-beta repeat [Leishmania donovani]|uniref:WD_domain_G-beta_repeat_putative/Pfam:PF00400 n=1 Tax=Leishmania donovani TaxID=5661 RepID=A0A6J8FQ16_LEIDO|nr:WD domain G-beta repeat [Leishmania donovani]VDZ48972.1 WD_domain_G-beta_repeat_putative/Pfam:PF00400 [Leishmania donovani]